jgi:hypothetical protein
MVAAIPYAQLDAVFFAEKLMNSRNRLYSVLALVAFASVINTAYAGCRFYNDQGDSFGLMGGECVLLYDKSAYKDFVCARFKRVEELPQWNDKIVKTSHDHGDKARLFEGAPGEHQIEVVVGGHGAKNIDLPPSIQKKATVVWCGQGPEFEDGFVSKGP